MTRRRWLRKFHHQLTPQSSRISLSNCMPEDLHPNMLIRLHASDTAVGERHFKDTLHSPDCCPAASGAACFHQLIRRRNAAQPCAPIARECFRAD
jgi:hypothetical protein